MAITTADFMRKEMREESKGENGGGVGLGEVMVGEETLIDKRDGQKYR